MQVKIKIFTGDSSDWVEKSLNKWTAEQQNRIKVLSTHYSAASANEPSRFNNPILAIKHCAAIFYEEVTPENH